MGLRVLVLGGIGFVGRNFVRFLIEENLVDFVRVADKVLPQTAYLSESTKDIIEKDGRVEFMQAYLINSKFIEKAFDLEDGEFDYVFNCAAETKYGQNEEVYDEKVYGLTIACAKEAAKRNIQCFVELSTAQVYEADKKPADESSNLKPWTLLAKYKLKAEEELKNIPNLKYVVLRPAIIYGPNDRYGITPRLIMGAVYKSLNEEMKLLWSKDLKINTVHVSDVCRAMWFVAATVEQKGGRTGPVQTGAVYNLCDHNDTDQGKINELIGNIFGIKTGFQGTVIDLMAKTDMEAALEEVNDKHLQPWSELCKISGVLNTPLTPYLDKELLKEYSLSINGSKIESEGFQYQVPHVTETLLKDVINEFVAIGIWPSGSF